MSHQDKFWGKFGQKIRGHQPDAYTEGDWAAMEQLLNQPTGSSRRRNGKLMALVLMAILAGYLAGAWFGLPSTPETLGAFPIPMAGIARAENSTSEAGRLTIASPDLEGRESEPARTRPAGPEKSSPSNLSSGSSSSIKGATKNRPDYVPVSHLNNQAEGAAGPPVESILPAAAVPTDTTGYLSRSNRLAGIVLPLSLPEGGAIVQGDTTAASEFEVLAGKKKAGFYGGWILGANLSAINISEASYSPYPFGGFFAGVRLNPRWALQAEAHLKYVDNLTARYEKTERLELNNGYFFDQASAGVAEKSYLAIELPLLARYKLSRSWDLSAGLRPAFILDEVSLSTGGLQQDAATAATGANSNQAGTRAQNPELRPFDLGLSVGIEYALGRSWSVNAQFTRGLQDLSSNEAFQDNTRHFNTDLQFSIRCNF